RLAGLGGRWEAERNHGQRAGEGGAGVGWGDNFERDIETETLGAPRQALRVGQNIEGGQVERGTPRPGCERDIRPDARGLTQRQRQWSRHRRGPTGIRSWLARAVP